MPYTTTWIDPEIFLEYKGVTVYCTYKDDDYDQGARECWFTLDPEKGEFDGEDEGVFDIRNYGGDREYTGKVGNTYTYNDTRAEAMRKMIDLGVFGTDGRIHHEADKEDEDVLKCARCDQPLDPAKLDTYPGNETDGLYCDGHCYQKDHPSEEQTNGD